MAFEIHKSISRKHAIRNFVLYQVEAREKNGISAININTRLLFQFWKNAKVVRDTAGGAVFDPTVIHKMSKKWIKVTYGTMSLILYLFPCHLFRTSEEIYKLCPSKKNRCIVYFLFIISFSHSHETNKLILIKILIKYLKSFSIFLLGYPRPWPGWPAPGSAPVSTKFIDCCCIDDSN